MNKNPEEKTPAKEPSGQQAHPRRIRSFVVRSARMTESQQKAFDAHMSRWALECDSGPVDLKAIFGNTNPCTVEIGFGMGDSLAIMAERSPEQNFIGIEVHPPGIGRLLSLVEKQSLQNVRVMQGDAVELLANQFGDSSLSRVNIFFPDPWHKKKHHKRRLVQPAFIELIAKKLQAGGLLHIATDWEPYARHVLEVLEASAAFANLSPSSMFSTASELGRPETKFERRGLKLGHGVWDIAYQANS